MYCARIPRMFYTMQKQEQRNSRRKTPEEMTDAEIWNKICISRSGALGNCKKCEISDLCKYGEEAIKRGLV